jgi:outer membrane protein OmpA-like peptidoglycan-associated protein
MPKFGVIFAYFSKVNSSNYIINLRKMKRLVLAIMAVFLVLSIKAQYASDLTVSSQYPDDPQAAEVYQTSVDKQLNPKTSALRTTWVANKPGSNWFVSLRAGMGGVWGDSRPNFASPWKWFDDKEGYWHPTVGLSVGKWFSPVWGLRLDGSYGSVESFSGGELVSGVKYLTGTGDFLVNLKNFFLPYNPKGLFNPVLYVGAGLIRTGNSDAFFNILAKGGLQLNFRVCDAFDVFADGQLLVAPAGFDRNPHATVISSDVVTNATIGVTYRFNFRHFIKSSLVDQNQLDALNKEINDLRNRPQVVCPPVVVCPEPEVVQKVVESKQVELTPVFFKINSYTVRDEQLVSVARAAQYLLDNPNAKLEIKAYSDKKTGRPAYNLKLSEKRANAVAKILVQKFGIGQSRLKISFFGDKDQPFSENDKNRVAIFVR